MLPYIKGVLLATRVVRKYNTGENEQVFHKNNFACNELEKTIRNKIEGDPYFIKTSLNTTSSYALQLPTLIKDN